MHYYQFNISDYKSHTDHLDLIEDLAYRRLLDWCYLHEKPLPNDIDEISKLIRMRTHSESIAIVLREFFSESETGEFIHKRVFLEIEKANSKSSKARESANARWNKLKNANALQTESDRNATQDTRHKTQDTKPKKKKAAVFELPNWIDPEIWSAYIENRKKLKAPMTDHAKKLTISKLEKQIEQANDMLNQSILNGWKGVFDLKEDQSNETRQRTSKPSLAQRATDARREWERNNPE